MVKDDAEGAVAYARHGVAGRYVDQEVPQGLERRLRSRARRLRPFTRAQDLQLIPDRGCDRQRSEAHSGGDISNQGCLDGACNERQGGKGAWLMAQAVDQLGEKVVGPHPRCQRWHAGDNLVKAPQDGRGWSLMIVKERPVRVGIEATWTTTYWQFTS